MSAAKWSVRKCCWIMMTVSTRHYKTTSWIIIVSVSLEQVPFELLLEKLAICVAWLASFFELVWKSLKLAVGCTETILHPKGSHNTWNTDLF